MLATSQLRLAELGYKVFPCVGKKPLTLHGVHDATNNTDQIERWTQQWPNANWAIATDGLLVVDIDPLAEGSNSWPDDYEKALDLAAAPISLTPRGGKHFVFRQAEDMNLGNSVSTLAPNVDTRGNGGYIVAPPSMNDGKAYRWLAGELELRPHELPLPPNWLIENLTGTVRKKCDAPATANKIPERQRNVALTRMAGYLRRAGHDAGEIFSLLSTVNHNRCQPPLDESEIRTIAKSVGRYPPDEKTMTKIEQNEDSSGWKPVLINLADVEPEAIRWLWPGRIALGCLTLIAGEPGQGKSTMLADLSARVTTGKAWPDEQANQERGSVVMASPGSVVLLSAEDHIGYTIRPRLDAAGADVSKVTALQGLRFGDTSKERCFNLESDLPLLEQAIQSSSDCRLIILDPVSSYTGKIDSHKNAESRGLLAPLATLASRYNVAVVMVTHFSKGQNRKAIHAPTGSIAYIAASRAAWAVVADKNNPERRLFLSIKNNLAKDAGGLAFKIVDRVVNGQLIGAVEWEPDRVNTTADEALNDEVSPGLSALDHAKTWLSDYLSVGSKPATEVEEAAGAELIKTATLKRAKTELNVKSKQVRTEGGSHWEWYMPGCSLFPRRAEDAPHTVELLSA